MAGEEEKWVNTVTKDISTKKNIHCIFYIHMYYVCMSGCHILFESKKNQT